MEDDVTDLDCVLVHMDGLGIDVKHVSLVVNGTSIYVQILKGTLQLQYAIVCSCVLLILSKWRNMYITREVHMYKRMDWNQL